MKSNNLIVIIGATAIGKTRLAIELAKHYACKIISCDSRQFFKEMSIGTAVPTEEELSEVPHFFIQNKSIHQPYSVGDFEREALQKLDELFKENNTQIMVGGSGLYVDAVLEGFDVFPEVLPEIRLKVKENYEEFGIKYLQEELKNRDLDYYTHLLNKNPQTLENPQRMQRFVAVSMSAEKPYSSFLNQPKKERNFNPIIIGLMADRAVMYERINQRVDLMMNVGLLDEVKSLENHKNLNALQTVGYRELFDFLEGTIDLETAIETIKRNTRRFAKRQQTWFKKYETAHWFDYQTPVEKIIEQIEKEKL